ncbi:kinesin-like protein KIF3A-like isoform X2 [Hibiscus syriacus]|uniref:Kinesin-like protein KIF3A-like isoform X2 n=1 Tax=Hibiscus syriacus TaxID=106335 RepID=A0A6A2Z6W1_HIBSY|nr:kinesin-like protein KIF3A-like isoform X2 [Hibiscus syriacus]
MNHSPGNPPAADIHFMQMKAMDSKKSIRNLGETIHSLLGFKSPINSAWVKSVCQIIKSLPNEDESAAEEFSKIKEEVASLTHCINQLNTQRRQLLHELLELKGNIRVFCRVRPLTLEENIGGLGFVFGPVVALDTSDLLLELGNNKSKRYTFDKVFHGSSQDGVFSEVEPVIKSVLDGYNACIFAYGQTGTGKTFTMEGTLESPGIMPRTIETLFKQTEDSNHTFLITFSMLEIYLGNLRDLLVPQATRSTDPLPPCLSIQTDPKGGIGIENLVSIQVSNFNQALKLYRFGCQLRSTASTNSNTTSSRSHCMIRISITCFDAPERRRETNKIWLVDLGGSERVVKTKAWGRRLDEGRAINLSLSALGDVIHALQRRKCHIPYRNSKLTRVLKDSLGDDSKTLMLVHVSPKEEDLCETICSLNFAARVKSVRLGHDESNQKIKEIEDERQHIRRKIQILNHKLEVTRKRLPVEEQVESSDLSTELVRSSELEFTKSIKGNVRPEVPRFMRSTNCSRTKTGMERQTSLHSRRKRRPTFQRAGSVSFPVKNHSECNSDRSISRSTCAVELNRKTSVELDNATVYSQDISECDIKTVILPDQNVPQMTSNHRNMEKRGSRKSNKCNSTKVSKVDQWLTLHKDEPTITASAPRNKWVLDIPLPEKKQTPNGEKMQWNGNKMQKQAALDQRVEDKPPTLKDFFAEESSSNLICSPQSTTDDQKDSLDGSLVDDSQGCSGSLSPPYSCCDESENFDKENEFYATPMVQAVGDTDHSMIEISGYQFSPFDLDDSISNSQFLVVHPKNSVETKTFNLQQKRD